jgi:hypothetical protein
MRDIRNWILNFKLTIMSWLQNPLVRKLLFKFQNSRIIRISKSIIYSAAKILLGGTLSNNFYDIDSTQRAADRWLAISPRTDRIGDFHLKRKGAVIVMFAILGSRLDWPRWALSRTDPAGHVPTFAKPSRQRKK